MQHRLVKEQFPLPAASDDRENVQELSELKEKALRYVAGYVILIAIDTIRKLHHPKQPLLLHGLWLWELAWHNEEQATLNWRSLWQSISTWTFICMLPWSYLSKSRRQLLVFLWIDNFSRSGLTRPGMASLESQSQPFFNSVMLIRSISYGCHACELHTFCIQQLVWRSVSTVNSEN